MDISLDFLKDLKQNNSREWFNKNKPAYEDSKQEFHELVDHITHLMGDFDELDMSKVKVFRIYRDIRFSKDKTPYQCSWRASFGRAGANRRGGYYLKIEPDNSCILGGFFGPEPGDMLHIRKQLQFQHERLSSILQEEKFKNVFGSLQGDKVKTAPKGFSKVDPAIEFLKFKQLLVRHDFTDEEVQSADFPKKVAEGFQRMLPFFDFMTEILTTDLNGESIT
jgi:uncharacterized protein (TIGR02453 family)